MRAAVTRTRGIEVIDTADPTPGPGHVLVRTIACGVCGSDLHAAEDLAHFAELTARVGGPGGLDPSLDVVFGHEFSAEIVDYGPGTQRSLPTGTAVCSLPIIFGPTGPETVGYSNTFPGGLGQLMVLQEALLLPVPDGIAPEHAALTEPLAVGEHAVGIAGLNGDEACVVIGCGPIGLAVVAALRARGAGPIIAADFSPTRRRLAELLGADDVIDPATASPYGKWSELGIPTTMGERAALEMLGGTGRDAVIFEAVGVPGVLQSIIDGAPPRARIVVVGVCMHADHVEPFVAIAKELQVRFAFGYNQAEFAATLDRLGRGDIPTSELVTDLVDLDDAPAAFDALRTPGEHGKLLIRH